MKLTTPHLLTLFIFLFSTSIHAEVSRSTFTTNIQDREPVDQLYALTDNLKEVFYFSELKNLQGQTITHQWSNAGKASHSITFDVGANRWRVYSSKTLNKPEGTWTVTVSDANGLILKEESISYGNAGTAEITNRTPQEKTTNEEETTLSAETNTPHTEAEKQETTGVETSTQKTSKQADANTNKTPDDQSEENTENTDNNQPVWDNL
jgi:hypothetical protein